MEAQKKLIEELHFLLRLPINKSSELDNLVILDLFLTTMRSEYEDFLVAVEGYNASKSVRSREEIAETISRLFYSVLSFAVAFGIDLEKELKETHQFNVKRAKEMQDRGIV